MTCSEFHARNKELGRHPNAAVITTIGFHAHIVNRLRGEVVQCDGGGGGVHRLPGVGLGSLILQRPGILSLGSCPGNGGSMIVHGSGDVGDLRAGGVQRHIIDGSRGLDAAVVVIVPRENEVLLAGVLRGNQQRLGGELIHVVVAGQVVAREHAGHGGLVHHGHLHEVVRITHASEVEGQQNIAGGKGDRNVGMGDGSLRYIIFISNTIGGGDVQFVVVEALGLADVPFVGILTVHNRPEQVRLSFVETAGEGQRGSDDVAVITRIELNGVVVCCHETDQRAGGRLSEGFINRLEGVAHHDGVAILCEVDVGRIVGVEGADSKFAVHKHHQLGDVITGVREHFRDGHHHRGHRFAGESFRGVHRGNELIEAVVHAAGSDDTAGDDITGVVFVGDDRVIVVVNQQTAGSIFDIDIAAGAVNEGHIAGDLEQVGVLSRIVGGDIVDKHGEGVGSGDRGAHLLAEGGVRGNRSRGVEGEGTVVEDRV